MATYKILIKNAAGSMQFATEKVEITKQEIQDGEIVEVGTGNYKIVDFETESETTVKQKFKDLLKTYKMDELNIIDDLKEVINVDITLSQTEPTD